jgi:predicted component of type VI protein secretion system
LESTYFFSRLGEFVIGRAKECKIHVNGEGVSLQHCALRVEADGAFIRNLGSPAGTFVNSKRIMKEQSLDKGDIIQVGPAILGVCVENRVLKAWGEMAAGRQPKEQSGVTKDPQASQLGQNTELWDPLLAACPPEHHELLRLKRQGLSLAEIAARTGLDESSVCRILYDLARQFGVFRF